MMHEFTRNWENMQALTKLEQMLQVNQLSKILYFFKKKADYFILSVFDLITFVGNYQN